jgi:hypothetical protein
LIAGGTFFLSTFLAFYSTLLNYWYYYALFLLAAGAFIYFDRYEQRKDRPGLQAVYTLSIIIIIIVFLYTVIPIFIKPLGFQDFLLRESSGELFCLTPYPLDPVGGRFCRC